MQLVMAKDKINEATVVASSRSSSRSRGRGQLEQDKMTARVQELAGRLSEILGDEFVKTEVEPILKLNKKKIN